MNFFHTVLALCTSFQAYREVRDRPFGDSVKHLLKLVTLLGLMLTLSLIPLALKSTDTLAQRFDTGRPDFSIQNGRVVTAATEPRYWGDDELRFGLVPAGPAVESNPPALYGLVFHADHFVFWTTVTNVTPAAVRQFENKLNGFPDGPVDGEYFRRLLRWTLPVLLPMGWVLLILVGMLTAMLQAYTFALIGSLMERNLPGGLNFSQLLNVTLHAVTPAAILVTVYLALQLRGLDLWLVYLIAFGVFLLGATSACRDGKPDTEEEDML